MKQLKTYSKNRFKALEDSLESYRHIQDAEKLHKIRVEIKKIKVILNLINFCTYKFKRHRQFIPFRTIFRRAGEIRQPEVFYKLLLLYQIGGVSDDQIPKSKKIDALGLAFQKEVPQFLNSISKQKKKLKRYFDNVSKEKAKKYLKKKKSEVEHLLFPSFNSEKLHLARKISKEIIYLHWVDKHKKADPFYVEVENIIGQWHDKHMLLPILRKSKAADDVTDLVAASKEDLAKLKELATRHYSPSVIVND